MTRCSSEASASCRRLLLPPPQELLQELLLPVMLRRSIVAAASSSGGVGVGVATDIATLGLNFSWAGMQLQAPSAIAVTAVAAPVLQTIAPATVTPGSTLIIIGANFCRGDPGAAGSACPAKPPAGAAVPAGSAAPP